MSYFLVSIFNNKLFFVLVCALLTSKKLIGGVLSTVFVFNSRGVVYVYTLYFVCKGHMAYWPLRVCNLKDNISVFLINYYKRCLFISYYTPVQCVSEGLKSHFIITIFNEKGHYAFFFFSFLSNITLTD